MSTVIITTGLTITNECANAGFLKKLFGFSDDKKEDKKKDKEVKEEEDKSKKKEEQKSKDKEKDKSKEESSKSKDEDEKLEKKSKKTDEEGKESTAVEEEDLEKTRDEDDIKKELEQPEKDEQEMHIAVEFKDGTKITKGDILKEIGEIAGQPTQKMSFNDMMLLFEFKSAYEKLINDEAKKKKLDEDEEVQKSLKDRQTAVATFSFLADQTEKLMTKKELKKFYDDTWDKHIKGTNQVSLILIQVPNKKFADQIKKEVKNEEDLKKVIKNLQERGNKNVATVPLEDYPESALPPEIIKEMKEKGKNAIIGPFPMQGVFTMFFVKSFHKAKKKEFSGEMIPQMKQIASKEFSTKYVNSLIEKYKVEVYDLNGDKVDIKEKDKKDKKDKKQPPMLSKIKDTQVIAKIGDKEKLTIADLYKMFNIKSLENEIFGSLAMQLKINIEEVIQNAIKLCVQDKLLSLELEKEKYMETKKMKRLCKKVEQQHLRNAYFAKTVKIRESDAKKEYDKYIKMIKPAEKDDNEISLKLMFYKTAKDAEAAIKLYKGKPKKFNEDFAARVKKKENALNVGYVKRQEVPGDIWNVIKKCTPGTCVNQVMQLDGGVYGFKGYNFAVAYIGDRRPIKLPTFQETKAMFKKVAEKMQAIAICDELFKKNVVSIEGKKYLEIPEEFRQKLLIAIIQGDMKSEQMNNDRN